MGSIQDYFNDPDLASKYDLGGFCRECGASIPPRDGEGRGPCCAPELEGYRLKVLDCFAGIGGFSLGLEWTGGFKTVGFVEIDAACQQHLKRRWPNVPVLSDITKITKETLAHAGIHQLDVVTGGFPCQDISFAGWGAGLAGSRSGLWYELLRVIAEVRPRYALIENVAALRSRGLDEVLRGLTEIGYDAEWHCIPASAVGAPHQRDRIWIVAYPSRVQQGREEQRAEWERAGEGRQPVTAALTVADSLFARLEGHAGDGQDWAGRQEQDRPAGPARLLCAGDAARWWESEPDVGRVAHGVPCRVDRLKQLGNAVVPQIPQLLGRLVLADWLSELDRETHLSM